LAGRQAKETEHREPPEKKWGATLHGGRRVASRPWGKQAQTRPGPAASAAT
jgi:hypothetical protein